MPPALIQQLLDSGLIAASEIERLGASCAGDDTALVVALSRALGPESDWIAERLAEASGLLLFDLEAGELSPEATGLLPEDLAIQTCAVATSFTGNATSGTAQIVMANPLDLAARDLILSTVGVHVEFGVARAASILNALDASGLAGSPDLQPLAPDATGRVTSDSLLPSVRTHDGTVPAQRLDALASPQQRIEALVLTLVSEGVIERSAYEDTLERCLRQAHQDDSDH
jgi:hypothetical protein